MSSLNNEALHYILLKKQILFAKFMTVTDVAEDDYHNRSLIKAMIDEGDEKIMIRFSASTFIGRN